MSKDVNQIVVCQEDYDTKADFENAIKDAVIVLLNNNYIMTVRYDDKGLGIVTIDFNYDDESFGCDYPYGLSPDEWESVAWDDERGEKDD